MKSYNVQASTFPGVPIYGGSQQVEAATKIVKDKEEFTIGENTHIKYVLLPLPNPHPY